MLTTQTAHANIQISWRVTDDIMLIKFRRSHNKGYNHRNINEIRIQLVPTPMHAMTLSHTSTITMVVTATT
jgi:hypothetical protein